MPLFFVMLIVTVIEVILITKVSVAIGFWMTFFLIIATAYIGSRLLASQWRAVMGKLHTLDGNPPETLLEALVLIVSGVLLITPGFLTDIIGFLGLVPQTRRYLMHFFRRHAHRVIKNKHFTMTGFMSGSAGQFTGFGASPKTPDDEIIEGEFEYQSDAHPQQTAGKNGDNTAHLDNDSANQSANQRTNNDPSHRIDT